MNPIDKGRRAAELLASDEWAEAWDAYRTRIFEEISAARSDDDKTVMHLKRLLAAADGAKKHLERLIAEGKMAATELDLKAQRESKLAEWRRRFVA